MPGIRVTPPAAVHLLDDMQALHRQVRLRTMPGGSMHIADPASLHATLLTLTEAMELIPAITGHLADHLTEWRDAQAVATSPLYEGAMGTDEICGVVMLAMRSANTFQENATRSLRALLQALSYLSPNLPERDPNHESRTYQEGLTARQRVAHLYRRAQDPEPSTDDTTWTQSRYRQLLLDTMMTLLAEGRRAEAVKIATDPAVSKGEWRVPLIAQLLEVVEMLVGVEENGVEG